MWLLASGKQNKGLSDVPVTVPTHPSGITGIPVAPEGLQSVITNTYCYSTCRETWGAHVEGMGH